MCISGAFMMEFGSMRNNILFFACIWFCACSTMDPEIPDYESLENDPLPLPRSNRQVGFFCGRQR